MSPAAEIQPVQQNAPANPADHTGGVRLLRIVFAVLFLQIVLVISLSFLLQKDPVFIERSGIGQVGLDFHDFYVAANTWLSGGNPYSYPRFITPPFSLSVALPFAKLPFAIATRIFFLLNMGLMLFALASFAKFLGLSKESRLLIVMIALIYYPFLFEAERENLDGLVLAALLFGLQARNQVARIVLLAMSMGLKVYTGLLTLALARRRMWRTAIAVTAAILLLQLPFACSRSFLNNVFSRAGEISPTANLSPAHILFVLAIPGWKAIWMTLWVVSLIFVLWRDAEGQENPETLLRYVPWMMSMPLLVYPYCGVLFLPLLALVAKRAQNGNPSKGDAYLIAGFLLTSFQAVAFSLFFASSQVIVGLCHLATSTGTLLLMAGVCIEAATSKNRQLSARTCA